jgi:hypothetical protein
MTKKKSRRSLRLSIYSGQQASLLLRVARLVVRDTAADAVLLAVDALLLGLGQVTIVRGHVGFLAILNRRLALLEIRGLLRAQSSICHAIPNALLLVAFATVYLVYPRMSGINHAGSRARSVVAGGGLRSGGPD